MSKKTTEDIISVLIVDDHWAIRTSMMKLINTQRDMKTIGVASDGEEAIEMAKKLSPDVILMDVNMPIMNGIEATKKIKNTLPDIIIIGLSLHDSKQLIQDMRKAGASAYVIKGTGNICDTIRRIIK